MDIKRPDTFLPTTPKCSILPNYRILTEDVEQIAIVKAALLSCTVEQERILLSVQRRLTDDKHKTKSKICSKVFELGKMWEFALQACMSGKKKIDICTQESNAIELQLSAVETKIAEALLLSQEAESEALRTVKENGNIKRKIIVLKNEVEEQGRIIKRANETIQVITESYLRSNKKLKVLPDAPT